MINFLSSWVKNLSLAIIVVSILEMLVPNNKTKKYIKMVMGLYVLFSIVYPFIENNNKFDFNNIDFDSYVDKNIVSVDSKDVNQESMDKRIKEIYIEELEKNITQKIEENGYSVNTCKVDADVSNEKDLSNSKINKIDLNVSKKEQQSLETENIVNENSYNVVDVKKVEKVVIGNSQNSNEISKNDVEQIKKILKDEYGVDEKCLKVN